MLYLISPSLLLYFNWWHNKHSYATNIPFVPQLCFVSFTRRWNILNHGRKFIFYSISPFLFLYFCITLRYKQSILSEALLGLLYMAGKYSKSWEKVCILLHFSLLASAFLYILTLQTFHFILSFVASLLYRCAGSHTLRNSAAIFQDHTSILLRQSPLVYFVLPTGGWRFGCVCEIACMCVCGYGINVGVIEYLEDFMYYGLVLVIESRREMSLFRHVWM